MKMELSAQTKLEGFLRWLTSCCKSLMILVFFSISALISLTWRQTKKKRALRTLSDSSFSHHLSPFTKTYPTSIHPFIISTALSSRRHAWPFPSWLWAVGGFHNEMVLINVVMGRAEPHGGQCYPLSLFFHILGNNLIWVIFLSISHGCSFLRPLC